MLFLTFTWAGAVFNAESVVEFGDLMILGMALPNILGVIMMSRGLKGDLDLYMRRLRDGVFVRYG